MDKRKENKDYLLIEFDFLPMAPVSQIVSVYNTIREAKKKQNISNLPEVEEGFLRLLKVLPPEKRKAFKEAIQQQKE